MLDRFGCFVDTFSSSCINECNRYMTCVLNYGTEWNAGVEASDTDPTSIFAACLAVDSHVAHQRIDLAKQVLSGLLRRLSDGDCDSRARMYVHALDDWLMKGDFESAGSVFTKIALTYTSDLFAFKRALLMYFFANKNHLAIDLFENSQYVPVQNTLSAGPYYHAMYSFVLEQAGRPAEALEAAELGMSFFASDPWAHHGVLHAMQSMGRDYDALRLLTPVSQCWVRSALCSFMFNHLWMHIAICALNCEAYHAAMKVFKRRLWVHDKSDNEVLMSALGVGLKLWARMQLETIFIARKHNIQMESNLSCALTAYKEHVDSDHFAVFFEYGIDLRSDLLTSLKDVLDAVHKLGGSEWINSSACSPLLRILARVACAIVHNTTLNVTPASNTCSVEHSVTEVLSKLLSSASDSSSCEPQTINCDLGIEEALYRLAEQTRDGGMRGLIGSSEQVEVIFELVIVFGVLLMIRKKGSEQGRQVEAGTKSLCLSWIAQNGSFIFNPGALEHALTIHNKNAQSSSIGSSIDTKNDIDRRTSIYEKVWNYLHQSDDQNKHKKNGFPLNADRDKEIMRATMVIIDEMVLQ